uniref:Putative RNA processing-related protein, mitochondrial RNA degradation n=1 Tax=Moniliophthora roreri TaxID=221103 RepID=A0A0W0EVD7_MONRR
MSLNCYARARPSLRLTRSLFLRRHSSTSSFIEDVSVPPSSTSQKRTTVADLTQKTLENKKNNTSSVLQVLQAISQSANQESATRPELGKPKKRKKEQKAEVDERQRGKLPKYSRKLEGLILPKETQVLTDLTPPTKQNPISVLAHGLDRVLFNPGIYWLRDPRSRVYNFPPTLEVIPKVFDFAFERLTGFVKSSSDEDLWSLARKEGRRFGGSTSSLSGMLSQIYFLISENKEVDTSTLSAGFRRQPSNFTPGQRMAASVVFNYNDGGTLLEKYLTMSTEEFLAYMRTHPQPVIEDEKVSDGPTREAYRYSKSEKFVMRSQLDCHDNRLPGTGVFDIKTRACMPIRMDILNFKESSGYLITKQHGLTESFEREYYDLVRSAFLKYSFQARIGNMDGVFVAYHNTARMFGFQYVSLDEMDQRLFSQHKGAGDRVFQKCVELMEVVADEVATCFPHESVKCTFETEEGSKVMNVWVEPADWVAPDHKAMCPIKQLCVTTRSFLGNGPVGGNVAVENATEPWTIHWVVSRLEAPEADIRKNLQKAKERQFRAYSLPSGVDFPQIEEWWTKLSFGGKALPIESAAVEGGRMDSALTEGASLSSKSKPVDAKPSIATKAEPLATVTEAAEEPPASLEDISSASTVISELKPTSDGVKQSSSHSSESEITSPAESEFSRTDLPPFFRENFAKPDRHIRELRKLARRGRRASERLAAEERGKPKIVWGVGEVYLDETIFDGVNTVGEEIVVEAAKEEESRSEAAREEESRIEAAKGETSDEASRDEAVDEILGAVRREVESRRRKD